jgi:hypothetical protein
MHSNFTPFVDASRTLFMHALPKFSLKIAATLTGVPKRVRKTKIGEWCCKGMVLPSVTFFLPHFIGTKFFYSPVKPIFAALFTTIFK